MSTTNSVSFSPKTLLALTLVVVLLPMTLSATRLVPPASAATGPGNIKLQVVAARSVGPAAGLIHKGDAVTSYKWIVNEDDTGDPGAASAPLLDRCLPPRAAGGSSNADYADTCPWPSTRQTSGYSPIVAQGTDADLNGSTSLDGLPQGKYLLSVTADGYKIGGQHFVVAGDTQTVKVDLDPTPLPLATIRIDVFDDSVPVDGTFEVDAERPLAGFTAHLTDVFGDVSTDYYGNALCTAYQHVGGNPSAPLVFDADNHPIVDTTRSSGHCTSDAGGHIVIPNLGPNRLAATVAPPAAQTGQWVQTTTLEGGHDYDIWSQEGATGYDTELVKGGEPVASVQFGFVHVRGLPARTPAATGEIKGVAVAGLPYVGGQNGQVVPETGFAGANIDGPIARPWVALSDLDAGDAAVYVGRGQADGSFDITGVPDGLYQLTIWDDDQDYILWSFNVEVSDGGVSDVGNKMLVGWFTHLHGHVFIDSNENGRRDPGEAGVPQFPLTIRERDNSLMDQYTNTASTDSSGSYDIRETYPLSKWLVLEAFNTRYRTTGITYRAENDPTPTTKRGGLVDLDFLPVIGLSGQVDWGVMPYTSSTNGGIAGTVSYDVTRNELDPADAASEGYQPGIPDLPVHLYASVPCAVTDAAAVANECRQGKEIVPLTVPDPANPGQTMKNPDPDRGSMVKGPELSDAYTSEEWAPPRGCTARDYSGEPLTDQLALPDFGEDANRLCVEAPMMGVAIGPSDKTPEDASQTVNGNYGFSSSKLNLYAPGSALNPAPDKQFPLYGDLAAAGYPEQDLRPGDYIVAVEIPDNPVGGGQMYKATAEEDVNVFDGDGYLPQENINAITPALEQDPPGPPTPDVTPPSQPPSQQAGIISPCAGRLHKVDVTNQNFLDAGGSPFQGQDRPSCQDKLVTVRAGQTAAPNFNLFTDVPIPTHFWGLTINDLGLSLDKRSVEYGEAQGLPFVPMGLYDWSGRLLDTVHTDFNGFYEALEPSTSTYNCPVPAGPCPNMYRFTGNDPGSPDHPNADYNPRFRTISASFQGWPGLYTVTDTAPTQVATTALTPGSTAVNPTQCDLGATWPQLLSTDRPWIRLGDTAANRTVTLNGFGFGAAGTLRLNNTVVSTTTWSDTKIVFTVPTTAAPGPTTVEVTRGSNGLKTVNGLTLQILNGSATSAGGTATNPRLAEVGPGKQFATVQAALEAARPTSVNRYWLVVVWPGAQTALNPRGEYNENLIVHHRTRIQGVGPGGFRPDGSFVRGSILDGSGFNPDNAQGQAWITRLGTLTYSGQPEVPDAAVVTVLDDPTNGFAPASYPVTIDGFRITGGSQSDFPTNINEVTGGVKTPYGGDGAIVTQGGGIYVHSRVTGMQVTDNVIEGNGGSYGGGVRVGTPYRTDNLDTGFVLSRNQVRDNGGTNLAGGIGIFAGSANYQVTKNAICGNFSAEYGGAMTAFGWQTIAGGTIQGNRIWFNSSYDEGGAVMIAGELPADPAQLSEGSGPVTIDKNVISDNLANDDGGGIRLLQVAGSHISRLTPGTITITNNTVTNNVSTHEGGGISLDDAPFVTVSGNTVAKNLTTATAITSDGLPAPAGLSTSQNSDPLQARLRNTTLFPASQVLAATTFSRPTLLDNVFNDNRAGAFSGGWVTGIGGTLPDGSANDVNVWDMGVVDGGGTLSPAGSLISSDQGTDGGTSTTIAADAGFKDPSDVFVDVLAARSYPAFRQSLIIGELLPPNLSSDYHLVGTGSPAYGRGVASTQVTWGTGLLGFRYTVSAPSDDIDGQTRPSGTATQPRYDAGSDQLKP
ncbi:hypothetical protein GCM10009798_39640 [Nocardioides panacihumi]|uniref:Alpha-amylase n=1 Tax=Nocardioides panacihumi TaxID=400774 RepID=A0ABP5D889_9ACTN